MDPYIMSVFRETITIHLSSFLSQDAKLKIEAIQRMLQFAVKGEDLRSSRQLLKEHQQLEQEAQELADKINSIVSRAKHLATNHFDSQTILQETDTYLKL